MAHKFIIVFLHIFLSIVLHPSIAQTWMQAGYWYSGSEFSISDINSALFTHLICAFANLNSSSYQLSISYSDEQYFSVFTNTVKQKNPSITTLLSIGGGSANHSIILSMVSNSSHRKSFIDSSIKTARLYGFQGLDFSWVSANTSSDMSNMAILFEEWRAAIDSEERNSSQSELILTAAVPYSRYSQSSTYPVEALKRNLNWLHVMAYDFYSPTWENFTRAHAALYDPASNFNTDFGIESWINGGLPASKLVLGFPFYGYAWTLVDPKDNIIGAPASGPAISEDGDLMYKDIRNYIQRYGANSVYNGTYVVNYCTVGATWIGFDDVEVVKIKVSYAKEKKLLGYFVWQVSHDDNWMLSQAASGSANGDNPQKKGRLVLISILIPIVVLLLLVGALAYYLLRVKRKRKEMVHVSKYSKSKANQMTAAVDFNSNVPNLVVYSFSDIEVATDRFSRENKLGEGGYGPVYKGVLSDGQEIAVKKLSRTSAQGFEEFKNEVMLTAKLQHVNLVQVLGFCVDREEHMLVYEYMPNKSLDYYLYDPIKRFMLDWKKRVDIIEGVTQGLLYLQEYSRLTIIHRDMKASNILLDENMKPKISDFGMARIFTKDGVEANTNRIVGTYGYVPPEYVKNGLYSIKSDVYSFGVLLLQIISGKRNAHSYGLHENLSLLDFAYELWREGKGMEFVDPSLDDTSTSYKLLRCMQIALLCVQESANDRPTMLEVYSMLTNETTPVATPKRPAFSTKSNEGVEQKNSHLQREIYSIDNSPITEMVVR
ncbi:cysteine-rich receptor-like protein kinase 19 isoform X1 [Durio zibethinus]|uniref:non-specific serine/threonine protein kinase n=1 Tax=Durio zibethinus TaxID=66656 RepID=A0A6P5XQ00_DURZI|nr:cysteine-rich receptor-like protein kinase 19 isoform X1 [Durio zibethinus]